MACCARRCVLCCACAVVLKVAAILCVLAIVSAAYLSFELYLKPWGEAQLAKAPSFRADALACARCAGVNRAFPVTASATSGFSELEARLANDGWRVASGCAVAGVAVGAASVLVVLASALVVPASSTSTSATSSSSTNRLGFVALFMLGHGQFITLLGSLNLRGAPLFYLEFCRQFAWTNLQGFFPHETAFAASSLAVRALRAADDSESARPIGVQRYAQLVGVDAQHLFSYTCIAVAIAIGAVVGVYAITRGCVQLCTRDATETATYLDNRVVWATILLLSALQYVLVMTASFEIYDTLTSEPHATGTLVLAFFVLLGPCVGFVGFGVLKVAQHKHELDDIGTPAHECKTVRRKYGAYYDDFSKANVYFFVAKLGLEILSGAVVGAVHDPMVQIGVLVALNASFLVLVIVREPFVVRLFHYICILSGYLRVVLLLLSVVLASPDTFPQSARDFAAELVIGLNAVLFACLLARQIYGVTRALCQWCQSTSNVGFRASSSSASSASFSQSRIRSRLTSRDKRGDTRSGRRRRGDYEPRFTLQELIASKIRDDPPSAVATPPKHGTPPSREPYQGNPSHRYV